MLQIDRWKRVLIFGICLLGLLYALPNAFYARVEAHNDAVAKIEATGVETPELALAALSRGDQNAGLEVEDRIALTLDGDATLIEAAREHEPYVAGETLAVEVTYGGNGAGEQATIDGRDLRISLVRA